MKIITKPTSSPRRTEKPPPPLMLKFLRTNTIARSRGRSRSSPMFIRNRKNSSSIDTQSEPSSPKVTCIGQVRSSKPTSGRRTKSTAGFPCSCSWVNRNALFCTHFAKRLRPRSARRGWGKCRWFSLFGYCRSSRKSNAGSPEMESDRNDEYEDNEEEEEGEDELRVRELAIEGLDCCSLPPRNALLLTRCRSVPYRSSSLASRFWGQETGENRKGETQTLERESSCGDSSLGLRMDSVIEGNLGGFGEIEEGSMIDDGIKKMETGEGGGGGIGRGWVLTRCKSEPARSGERLKCL